MNRRSSLGVLLAIGSLVLLPLAGGAQLRGMALDEGSVVRFEARGQGLMRPARGQFAALSGQLELDPADLSTARGHVQVVLTSIRTPDAGWDEMFRAAPFLELDEHPRAQFALGQVRGPAALPPEQWVDVVLVGRFTLHGVTRDVELPARVKWSPDQDGRGRQSVDRLHVLSDFVIRWQDHRLILPPAAIGEYAGDHAAVHVDLLYRKP